MSHFTKSVDSNTLITVFDLPEELRNRIVRVVIVPDEETTLEKPKRKLGLLPGPELPDSFFDPLPEEELKAWGL